MFSFFGKMIRRILPDADERQRIKAQQAQDNRNMSKSDNRAASWRNGIGWVCVVGMAYQLIIRDLLIWGSKQGYYTLMTEPPELDGRIWSLVFGMLGIEVF